MKKKKKKNPTTPFLGRFMFLHASHKSQRILIFSPAAVTGNSSSHLTFNFGPRQLASQPASWPNVQRGQICRGHFGHMCALRMAMALPYSPTPTLFHSRCEQRVFLAIDDSR